MALNIRKIRISRYYQFTLWLFLLSLALMANCMEDALNHDWVSAFTAYGIGCVLMFWAVCRVCKKESY